MQYSVERSTDSPSAVCVGEEATSNIRGSEKMLPPHHPKAETFMEDLGEGLGKDILSQVSFILYPQVAIL
jgi:hypothetical protein